MNLYVNSSRRMRAAAFVLFSLSFAPIAFGSFVSLAFYLGKTDDSWKGKYIYEANLGRNAGGAAVAIAYEIEITSDNAVLGATITATGYQTDDALRCDTKTEGERINLYFNSYPDGGTKNQYDVELYKKGDLLLSLERVKVQNRMRYRAVWGKYNTDVKKSVYFKKES